MRGNDKLEGKEKVDEMKKSKYTQGADRVCFEAGGTGHADIGGVPELGVAEQTLYRWKSKYGGMLPSDRKRLRQLEEENARLKKLVADLSLDKLMLQDVLTKKSERLPGNGTPYGFCRNASRRANAEAAR